MRLRFFTLKRILCLFSSMTSMLASISSPTFRLSMSFCEMSSLCISASTLSPSSTKTPNSFMSFTLPLTMSPILCPFIYSCIGLGTSSLVLKEIFCLSLSIRTIFTSTSSPTLYKSVHLSCLFHEQSSLCKSPSTFPSLTKAPKFVSEVILPFITSPMLCVCKNSSKGFKSKFRRLTRNLFSLGLISMTSTSSSCPF